MMRFVLFILLLFGFAMQALADSSALINKQLETQQKLDVNALLPKAMQQISNQTGVSIDADAAIWDLLPWGQETAIKVKIERRTLREALNAITQKLGLEWTVGDDGIHLRPMPALRRLGRRCTPEELGELGVLSSTPLTFSENHATMPQLLESIGSQLARGKSRISIENRASVAPADPAQNLRVTVPPNATLAGALEELSRQTSVTWYVAGKNIVIVSKQQQVYSQLAKTLTKKYDGVDVSQVLLDLFQRAGVDFTIDAGAYQRIAGGYRTIHLQLDNATIQQALQTIGGYTGLSFDVTADGVHVSMPTLSATPTSAP
jgi:hypothetical protein